jgi:hypothetical protein
MKTLNYFCRKLVFLGVTSFILSLQSCVVYQQPHEAMVKVPDIIQMSKDGVSSKDIIAKIKRSHTVYTLKADQLAKLQKQGVADSVVNFMEQTRINSAIRNSQYNNIWGPGWGGMYGLYGYPYFGLSYAYGGYWGPSIIIRGGGHGGGRYR